MCCCCPTKVCCLCFLLVLVIVLIGFVFGFGVFAHGFDKIKHAIHDVDPSSSHMRPFLAPPPHSL